MIALLWGGPLVALASLRFPLCFAILINLLVLAHYSGSEVSSLP